MDILAHRIKAGLHGEVLGKGITGGHPELRPVVSLERPGLIDRTRHGSQGRQLVVGIEIIGTGPQYVKHGITDPHVQGELGGDIPTIAHIDSGLHRFLLLHPVLLHQRLPSIGKVFPRLQVVKQRAGTEIQRMLIA